MQIEKPGPLCKICNESTIFKKKYNSLFNGYVNVIICKNNHLIQYPIIDFCPICNLHAISICNELKKCQNNHFWIICIKCKDITISNNKKTKIYCEKCNPTKKNYFLNLFCK
jgi:hypothetical protein